MSSGPLFKLPKHFFPSGEFFCTFLPLGLGWACLERRCWLCSAANSLMCSCDVIICRVIELLEKVGERKADPHAYELSLLYEADRQQMHQITEYIHCQTEQAQQADSLQRYHLMNCGYDPLKVQAKQSHGGSGGGDTGSQDV